MVTNWCLRSLILNTKGCHEGSPKCNAADLRQAAAALLGLHGQLKEGQALELEGELGETQPEQEGRLMLTSRIS